jgi:copper chaperone NosL
MKNLLIISTTLWVSLSSCSSQTEPIQYGHDNCNFCKMTIMEKNYACELVTQKGKVYKFDDLSCLVKFMKTAKTQQNDYDFIVVNNFIKSNEFVDASKALFVNGEGVSSPMQGNLAAIKDLNDFENLKKQYKNLKIVSWKEAFEKFD